ncbi:hypothetical protein T4B_13117 [Trichinella pseudospiralis]|uniref:Uncharacterized protein n=1 Tax=Trichinella pseudospiralis TaxID=6337 RepID=A0A0V1J0J4_TRIPS|nr:hypothetical protein T4A_3729 [Trichinella pseudospiralis]KRZ28486.1 hypothetical protein T4B_13117 [Trichinella pseudospiralis]
MRKCYIGRYELRSAELHRFTHDRYALRSLGFEGWHFGLRKCYIGCYELRLRCCTDLQITDARKQLLGSLEIQTEKILRPLLRTTGSSR